MSVVKSLFMAALLLCLALSCAARPEPAFPNHNFAAKTHHQGVEAEQVEVVGENCEGVGEEECLMRRTLAAHIDYVYTQKKKP